MVLQSELLSHADRVGEGLMLSPPPVIYDVRARGIVFAGRSKSAELIYRYMVACVELYRMAKKAIWLCKVTSIRLLLCVGIKVVDEWQKSLY